MRWNLVRAAFAAVLLAGVASAQAGKSEQVGKPRQWGDTTILVGMDGRLWTIESDGNLYATNKEGEWKQVGAEGGWADTKAAFELEGHIVSFTKDGTLWRTNKGGEKTRIGKKGEFLDHHVTQVDGTLYAVDPNGTLFRVSSEGDKTKVSEKGALPGIVRWCGLDGELFLVTDDFTLWKSDLKGNRTQLGKSGDWANGDGPFGLKGMNGKLWIMWKHSIYECNKEGKYHVIGTRGEWKDFMRWTAMDGFIWVVTGGGNLFKVCTQ